MSTKPAISLKRCKIGSKLLLRTNRKSNARFRLVAKSMTLYDLERPKCTLVDNLIEDGHKVFSSGVPSHDLPQHNFCSGCAVRVVIFGHLNRSSFLLAYLLLYKFLDRVSRLLLAIV